MSKTVERPISFNSEMVKAILEGRKTQTRRPIKPQPYESEYNPGVFHVNNGNRGKDFVSMQVSIDWFLDKCPYGKIGNRLWVKEPLIMDYLPNLFTGEPTNATVIKYAASPDKDNLVNEHGFDLCWVWKSKTLDSHFMPRWASRITLEITNIRVERVQDITEEDAIKEGVLPHYHSASKCERLGDCKCGHIAGFRSIWDSIYSKKGYGWLKNPWVWVVEFKVVK